MQEEESGMLHDWGTEQWEARTACRQGALSHSCLTESS